MHRRVLQSPEGLPDPRCDSHSRRPADAADSAWTLQLKAHSGAAGTGLRWSSQYRKPCSRLCRLLGFEQKSKTRKWTRKTRQAAAERWSVQSNYPLFRMCASPCGKAFTWDTAQSKV